MLADDSDALIEAASFQNALTHVLRIAVDGTLDPDSATAGLKALLLRAGGAQDFAELEQHLTAVQSRARAAFEHLLGVR